MSVETAGRAAIEPSSRTYLAFGRYAGVGVTGGVLELIAVDHPTVADAARIDSIGTCRGSARGCGHVWSVRLVPGGPADRRRVRDRLGRRRRAPPAAVVEPRAHRPDPYRRRPARAPRGRRARRAHAAAAHGALGPGAVVGEGPVDRQPADQRARREPARQARVQAPVRAASGAAPRGRLLRVAGRGPGGADADEAALLPPPGRRRTPRARRALRVLEGPHQGRRRPCA